MGEPQLYWQGSSEVQVKENRYYSKSDEIS